MMMAFILFLLSVTAQAGSDAVTFEGTVMKFPSADQIPDLNLSGMAFSLATLPADATFMAGKVYRGELASKGTKLAGARIVSYVFAIGGTEAEGFSLSVSQGSSRRGSTGQYKLQCPSNAFASNDLSCKRSDGVTCRLSKKDGLPVLYCGGIDLEYQEVAALPEQVLK
jgi:hypothetical protein